MIRVRSAFAVPSAPARWASALRVGLLAALALGVRGPARAAPANQIAVGDLRAVLSTYDGIFAGTGLKLTYRGRPLITRSSVSVAAPDWSRGYFSMSRARARVEQSDVPAGKRLFFAVADETFEMAYAIDLLDGNRAVLDLQGTLRKDVPAILEYAAGYLSSVFVAGEPFNATTAEGEREGTMPFWSKGTEPGDAMVLPPVRRLQVDSRAGTVHIEAERDAPGLDLYDGRMIPQSWFRESPVFWLGHMRAPLKAGQPFHSRVALQVTAPAPRPRPERRAPAVEALPIRDVADVRLPAGQGAGPVIPKPQEWRQKPGVFALNPETRIVYAAGAGSRRAARELRERLREEHGLRVPVVPAGAWRDRRNVIAIGTLRSPATRRWLSEAELQPVRQPEGYALRVASDSVVIAGADARGALYGVFTLLQLAHPESGRVEERGNGSGEVPPAGAAPSPRRPLAASPTRPLAHSPTLRLPAGVIRDWPALPVRGVHLLTDHWSTFLHRDLIRSVLAPHKINTILLECEYVKWDRHPELHMPWGMSKQEVRALLALARDYHIEVIPLVRTLGHVGWMFQNNQHLDLAEDPQAKFAYCPSNPKTYELVFDVLDEALELFGHPRFLHIGHDEFTHRGRFAQDGPCKGRDVVDLMLEDTRRLHDFLARRGARTAMWGDMLLGPGEAHDATSAETLDAARRAREGLPEDILVTDWHYAPAADYPSLGILRRAGFDVWAATWNQPKNVYGFARTAADGGAGGLIQTTWTGYSGNMTALRREFPQLWAYILAAEYAWSPGAPAVDEAAAAAPQRFRQVWPGVPHTRRGLPGFVVDLGPLGALPWQDSAQRDGWLGYGPTHDLSALASGTQRLGDTLFVLPESRKAIGLAGSLLPGRYAASAAIPLGRHAPELVFLLGTGWEAPEGQEVGRIVVRYADGTEMAVPLRYGWNIRAVRDPRPAFQAPVVWEGRSSGGDGLYLRAHTLWNPLPGKTVAEVRVESTGTDAAPVVLAVSGTDGARIPRGR